MRGRIFFLGIIAAAFAILNCGMAQAQNQLADSLVTRGDLLRAEYRFEESLAAYSKALEAVSDSVSTTADSLMRMKISDRMLLSENGKNMSSFAYRPSVIARHLFSADDFFLYYPLPDKSWRMVPNQLDTIPAERFSKAVYAPDDSERIFYSSKDAAGISNLYMIEYQDTIWTAPALINEQLTSVSNEIYPMLSPDGRHLYFASEGLQGVGGYDLFVSEWNDDEKDWSEPVNLGFPYSSPGDDLLLVNTPGGEYTLFASNRDCSPDSLWVYVLEFDNMPVRHSIEDPEELLELSRLEPVSADERMDGGNSLNVDLPQNVDVRKYIDKIKEVRSLRDSISNYGVLLNDARNRFGTIEDGNEKTALTQTIIRYENRLPVLQDSLQSASSQLQKIEMEFLFSGVVIDPDKVMEAADREVVGQTTSYKFTKKSPGGPLELKMMEPEEKFDYTFRILEEGQFALDNTIPDGLVYQIQIFSGSKATVKSLRGLSPVFEIKSGGRYVYRVGVFRSYKDVLANLNAVKRVGFRSAFIVAYIDGKDVSVSKARSFEAEKSKNLYEVRFTPSSDIDPAVMDGIRQQSDGKDIARTEDSEGNMIYIVGPYGDKATAEKLVDFIKAMGIQNVSCQPSGSVRQ